MDSCNIENQIPKQNVIPYRPKSAPAAVVSKSILASAITPSKITLTNNKSALGRTGTISSPCAAKEAMTAKKIQRTKELKEQWAKAKQEKLLLNKEKRQNDFKKLQESTQAAAEIRRRELELQRQFQEKEKLAKQELLASSLEDRKVMAQEKERQKKERRRMSIALNKQMLTLKQEKENELAAKKKEEEDKNLEARRLDFIQVREARKAESTRRRESMAFRGQLAKQQREISEELNNKTLEEDRSILEFRRSLWKDKQEMIAEQQKMERENVTKSLEEWRNQKVKEEKIIEKEDEFQKDLIQKRHEDWLDMENYKNVQAKRSRESLAGRLDHWRATKAIDEKHKEEEKEAQEYEYLLKQQEHEDVSAYELNEQKKRKLSLAYRLEKQLKDKDYENGQIALTKAKEEEDRQIKELERNDIENYKQSLADARRQSLEYRSQTEIQDRMRREGEAAAAAELAAADRELRVAAMKDVDEYKEKMAEDRRKSLSFRLVESRKQHEMELTAHQDKLHSVLHDLELKRLDWLAVQEEKKADNDRRRKSIMFRVDSWRQQRLAEEMLAAKKAYIEQKNRELIEQDREDILAYQDSLKAKTIKPNFLV